MDTTLEIVKALADTLGQASWLAAVVISLYIVVTSGSTVLIVYFIYRTIYNSISKFFDSQKNVIEKGFTPKKYLRISDKAVEPLNKLITDEFNGTLTSADVSRIEAALEGNTIHNTCINEETYKHLVRFLMNKVKSSAYLHTSDVNNLEKAWEKQHG